MSKKNVTEVVEEAVKEEAVAQAVDDGFTYEDVVRMLMTSASSFCTVLLAEQVDDDEAVVRSAEIAASLFDEVQYQMYRMANPIEDAPPPPPEPETVKKPKKKATKKK